MLPGVMAKVTLYVGSVSAMMAGEKYTLIILLEL